VTVAIALEVHFIATVAIGHGVTRKGQRARTVVGEGHEPVVVRCVSTAINAHDIRVAVGIKIAQNHASDIATTIVELR